MIPTGILTSYSTDGISSLFYSLRKYNSSYSGNAIRVRRSSDNSEQNIGFDSEGYLDIASLASFAGYQNLVRYSEDYSNVYWTKDGGSITTDTTQAPDGTTTADTFFESSANFVHRIYNSNTYVTGAVYTYSVYLKYIARQYVMIELSNSTGIQVIFDIQNGIVSASVGAVPPISTSIQSVGNGWYRCSITFNSASGSTIIIGGNNSGIAAALTYVGLNANAFYIWGSQLNIGYLPQSYQKVTSAANIAYITKWYDQSGNGYDAVQSTTSNQPQILIAPETGVIASSWCEGSQYLNTSSYTMGTSISTFWLGKRTGGISTGCFFGDSNADYDCRADQCQIQTSTFVGVFGSAFDLWAIGSLLRISGGSKAYINNSQSSTTNISALSAVGSRTLSIGKRGLDTAINLQGWIREVLIYNSNQTTNLSSINNNIQSYYSITTPIVTSGLLAYYDAGNTSSYSGSGSLWYDLSGNNNTATIYNSPTFSTLNGGNFIMNGTNNYITPLAKSLATSTTQSIWYKWNGVNQAKILSYLGDSASTGYGMYMNNGTNSGTAGNKISGLVAQTGYNNGGSTSSLSSTNWTNITMVRDSAGMRLYINGVQDGGGSASYFGSGVLNYSLGTSSGPFAAGNLAVVMYYNRALSASEILQNFNVQKSRFGL